MSYTWTNGDVITAVTKLSIEKFVIHSDNTVTHENVGYIGG